MRQRWKACCRTVPITLVIAALAACSAGTGDEHSPNPAADVPALSDQVLRERGSIVSSGELPAPSQVIVDSGARAIKFVYRSASGLDGSPREVSGSVFVPPGDAPPGGWPVIAYGHGTTGITNECGPSGYPDLLGYDQVVASLVRLGYVVALSDYEGLGHPGTHPYFEPNSAAFDLIDSVRAARALVSEAGSRWAAVGVSQGGHAAWAANELAGEYGDGLEFLGSASLSPAVDITGLAALADSGWLTRAQQFWFPMLVRGLRVTSPELDEDDYIHGDLADKRAVFLACTGPLAQQQAQTGALGRSDTEPATRAASDELRAALERVALPQRPANGPMLVITGDADDTVPVQWVTKAVAEACALGDVVEYVIRPTETHSNLNGGARVAEWLGERFAGQTPTDTC